MTQPTITVILCCYLSLLHSLRAPQTPLLLHLAPCANVCRVCVRRLLRAWSFQARLGLVTRTLLAAAPQLAHLLLIILVCAVPFALLSQLALGTRVGVISSLGGAIQETLRTLLGLAQLRMSEAFPPGLVTDPGDALLAALVYYGRELLFVMLLAQYFMATLGAVFVTLKGRQAGAAAAPGVGADLAAHVLPELRSTSAAVLRCGRGGRGGRALPSAQDASGGAAILPRSAAQLQAFLDKHGYAGLRGAHDFGDSVSALRVAGRLLDKNALIQLLTGLCAVAVGDDRPAGVRARLARSSAGRRAAAAVMAARTGAASSSSSGGGGNSGSSNGAVGTVTAPATAYLLPAADGLQLSAEDAAVVAGVRAAARQLLAVCGRPTDARRLEPEQLRLDEVEAIAAANEELRGGTDYTAEVCACLFANMCMCVPVNVRAPAHVCVPMCLLMCVCLLMCLLMCVCLLMFDVCVPANVCPCVCLPCAFPRVPNSS